MASPLRLLPISIICWAQFPGYEDVATPWGITGRNVAGGVDRKQYLIETTGNGVAIFDYDADGRNDVLFTNGRRFGPGVAPRPQLYRNEGGRFRDVSAAAGIVATGWGQGVCVADFNNDGHADLFLTFWGQNVLYRNTGRGSFTDVTRQAGLVTPAARWGAGCAFTDYDRDGDVDLFISNYVELDLAKTPKPGERPDCIWKGIPVACGPRGLPGAMNALYRNNGDGTFTDVSQSAGILKPGPRYGLGVAVADFNNDGAPDIYAACDMSPSLLYLNQSDGTFAERGVEAGTAYNFDGRLQSGMGAAVADFDRNGWLDIAKTNFSGDLPSLYLNEDAAFFTDVSQRAGLSLHQYVGWGVAAVDANEDGWPDLFLTNGHVYPEVEGKGLGERYRYPAVLYGNKGDGTFAEWMVTKPLPARGLAVGDLDGDGHPELAIVNMNDVPAILRNKANRANWLVVELSGTKSNRSAIGARVVLETEDGRQTQEVASGGSYFSHNSFALHFGLAGRTTVRRLEVRWPSGLRQEWTAVPANRKIRLTEGSHGELKP